jgi:exodeoxyribonuclease VII small subunit
MSSIAEELARLEDIVRRLEAEEVELDAALALFEEGVARLRAARERLGAVHLSDSNRHQPGTGHVPFEAIVATLREIGFDGVLAVECRLHGEPAQAVRECGAYLRRLVDGR